MIKPKSMAIIPGKMNTLTLTRYTPHGVYLESDGEEVLLPKKYVPAQFSAGQQIEVFVYFDSLDRIVATNLKPYLMADGFGCLKVIALSDAGAFLNMGLEKDLLLPFQEQKEAVKEGDDCLVYMYLDQKSNRLVGTTKIEKFIERDILELKEGDEAEILIGPWSISGYIVIIDNKYRGMIYHNEIFKPVAPGERIMGYVKKIRPDGLFDMSLQHIGYTEVELAAQKIEKILYENFGFLELNDNSKPETIYEILGMSKKIFKKAVGLLYKNHSILFEGDGIRLVGDSQV